MTMRINLLPPEILERRKAEARVGWVALAGIMVAVLLVAAYGFGFLQRQSKQSELASVQQQTKTTTAQANQLAVFEERATELQTRQQTATTALANRRPWAALFNELSLVMPSDIWLTALTANEEDGLEINGYAVDAADDSPDVGHKSMAKALVRLADLKLLTDVWLTNSAKATYAEQPVIQFSMTAKVSPNESGTP